MFKIYSSTDLLPAQVERVDSWALKSHIVKRVCLPDTDAKTWIAKEAKSTSAAKYELFAQEFLRLIIPHQPESRLACNAVFGTYYLLSEEVPGYRPLPEGESHHFKCGTYTGLGQAMLVSMFIQEIDLKNGNIGLNVQNQVIKIDGDRCFGPLLSNKFNGQYDITDYTIAGLPYALDFYAFNWLDLVIEGIKHPSSHILGKDIASSDQFRGEVNEAIHKLCLLPDYYIEKFVDFYFIAAGQPMLDLIKSRRDKLILCAFENQSFLEYFKGAKASMDATDMLGQMKAMSVLGLKICSDAEVQMLGEGFNQQADKLQQANMQQIDKAKQREDKYSQRQIPTAVAVVVKQSIVPEEKGLLRRFFSSAKRGFRPKAPPNEPVMIENLVNASLFRQPKRITMLQMSEDQSAEVAAEVNEEKCNSLSPVIFKGL